MIFTKPKRAVDRIFLHCSASDDPSLKGQRLVDVITQWHLARKFATIGYHFVIDKQGQVMKGRDIERAPAAQEHHNSGTIAICVHGHAIDRFTDAALAACLDLCDQINRAYQGKVTFHGHREVAAKECPVFDYVKLLQLKPGGRMPLELARAAPQTRPQDLSKGESK